MTFWKLSMLCLIPLLSGREMWRTWLALFGASLLAWLVPHSATAFLTLDLLAAAVVLRKPAGVAQKCIGLLFAGMAIADIGYIVGGQGDPLAFAQMLSFMGWVQFAVLLSWGAHDRWRHYLERNRPDRRVSHPPVGGV